MRLSALSHAAKADRHVRESKKTEQAVRADAAIDLVLEQIVYQTRLSTCATGAFIGLVRNGQLTYRATNGATSAEFVAYLRREPRVVDACLRSSSMQHVHNSENVKELDLAVCRSVGARSIVLFPVLNELSEKLGVLGAFSPQADAFAAGDLVKMQSLSHRVADTVARVSQLAYNSGSDSPTPVQKERERREHIPSDEGAKVAIGARTWLIAAVIVGISLLVGWELTRTTLPRARLHSAARSSPVVVAPASAAAPVPAAPVPVAPASTAAAAVNPAATVPVPAKTSKPVSVRRKQSGPDLEIESTPDDDASGIVLFEGKVAKPASTKPEDFEKSASGSSGPVVMRGEAALERLVNRVEPEYPDEAKAHRLQGRVVLDVLVSRDGKVERLNLVQGDPGLTTAATDAVRQWRFKPLILNGHSTSFETQVTLTFALP